MNRPGTDRAEIERALRELHAPDEEAARDRSLRVIRAATRSLPPARRRTFQPMRLAAVALATAALAIGLTPAGASVRDWIDDAVSGLEDERRALSDLPAEGRVLVTSPAGAWIVDSDGSRRRLGPYDEASWSPNGLFVAGVRGRQLVAVDPQGEIRWTISRPDALADPRWSPSGFRIAYVSGRQVRIVAGDGSGDRRLLRRAAAIAPAWRPPPVGLIATRHVIAYVDRRGQVVVADTDTRRTIWKASPGFAIVELSWLSNRRLVVAGRSEISIIGPGGHAVERIAQPQGATVSAIATSPTQQRIAVLRSRVVAAGAPHAELTGLGRLAELASIRLGTERPRTRTLFSAPGEFTGAEFSPDGRWVLLGWKDADQWLFLQPAVERKLLQSVVAIGDIARQLDPGGEGAATFPTIAGWCCGEG